MVMSCVGVLILSMVSRVCHRTAVTLTIGNEINLTIKDVVISTNIFICGLIHGGTS